jgi:serine/threonine protein phosphatase PrpC
MKIICSCVTDKGKFREINQDAIWIGQADQDGKIISTGAIFDGIGGLECGELASKTLALELKGWFTKITAWVDLRQIDKEVLFSHFRDEADFLNDIVRKIKQSEGINTGATMSAMLLVDHQYLILHVGDSRIYKYDGELDALTVDDIVFKQTGEKRKGYLTNYVGKVDEPVFSEYTGCVKAGECILFCSDGFYHQLREADLEVLKRKYRDEGELFFQIRKLVELMISRGERDNISVGVIKVVY